MVEILELWGIFLGSFLLNLVPFTGPSNILIALNAALVVNTNPILIGFLIALSSSIAKFIQYIITFFLHGFLKKETKMRIQTKGDFFKKWAALAVFIVAVSPLPDEPVIIPLGLIKYNPLKLFIAYFCGKILIGSIGAYIGNFGLNILGSIIDPNLLTISSILFTVIITFIIIKLDIEEIMKKVKEKIIKIF